MVPPKQVASGELKARLETYLNQVREGRILVVTNHGEPVAELRPLGVAQPKGIESPAWERLYASGTVARPTRKTMAPRRLFPGRGKSLTETLLEERNEERDWRA